MPAQRLFAVIFLLSALGTFAQDAPKNPMPEEAIAERIVHTPPGTDDSGGIVHVSSSHNWSQAPSDPPSLSAGTLARVTLKPCPIGLDGGNGYLYIYIGGAGKAEAVALQTGGTCTSGSASGTIVFTPANSHASGYTVGSATAGIQEASVAAALIPKAPLGSPQAGKVVVPPGEYNIYAPIDIVYDNQTVDFTGSILNCYVNDSCIIVGDRHNSFHSDITLVNPRGCPMVANGTAAFIEVNAQKTRVFNVSTRASSGSTFGTFVQVDDDQAFLLDGLDTNLGGAKTLRCDARFCGSFVTAPGPFNTWSAVGWLENMNISANCHGNGVDWQSGNTLHILDSVIQGQAQFAVRGGNRRGGFGNINLDNVYSELGSCQNPVAGLGVAGYIAQGRTWFVKGGEGPQGRLPLLANTGGTTYFYYIVGHNGQKVTTPIQFGTANTNGSGKISVSWPDINHNWPQSGTASSYDLLRVTSGRPPSYTMNPWGTGNWAVASSISQASACSNGVCTYTDNQLALTAYTVTDPPTWNPVLDFWNGDMILSGNSMLHIQNTELGGPWNAIRTAGSAMNTVADVVPLASYSRGLGGWSAPFQFTQGLGDGSLFTNLKGFVNFGPRLGIPSHVITLHDSQPMKTAAQPNKHPSNDVGDVYVGVDSVTEQGVGLALGSPAQVSQYIGNVGDNRNWKERLTANLKSFKVPIWLNGEVFSVSPRSTWNSYLHDGTSAVTFGRFIPDRGITVTRLSAQLLTAPAGCATPGSIIVTDGRTSTTLPLANGALSNDTPPLSQNYAAGSVLTVENTLGTGCSTHAARINVTVEFRTQ